jgi:hypothetical protein
MQTVVPANAGTHNPEFACCSTLGPQPCLLFTAVVMGPRVRGDDNVPESVHSYGAASSASSLVYSALTRL